MPAGWTNVLDLEDGTGTWGVDTGTRRVTIFQKDVTLGTETGTVTVSLAGDANNTLRATIHRIEVTSGYDVAIAGSTGADTTNGTGFSATGSTSIDFAANDLLLIAVAQNIDTGTQSSQSITASGITFGTRTNRASTAVTNGNDHRHIVDSVPVSSGSGTVAPTYSYTISAAGSGPVGFLRIREQAPAARDPLTYKDSLSGGNSTFTVSSVSVSAPTVAVGDLEIIEAASAFLAPTTAPILATPAGWNLAGYGASVASAGGLVNTRAHVFWRISPDTGSSATLDAGANAVFVYTRSSYSDPDPTSPFRQVVFNSTAAATTLSFSSLDVLDNSLLKGFTSLGAAQAITSPGSMSERQDNATYGVSSTDEESTAMGATGTRTFTWSSSSESVWAFSEFVGPVTAGGPTNYSLTCDVGSYSLTGIAALLRRGYSLTADVGSYALTGQNAALRRGYSLVCSTGAYAITGYDATLTYVPGPTAYSLTCDVGSYSLTGYDATLTYGAGPTNYSLTCDVGSYAITGYDATLTYSAGAANYSLSCDVGAYALTGIDATLTYTPGAAHYTLTCDTGAYALAGVAATLSFGRRLTADTGSYAMTGQAATLVYGRRLICATGSYSLTGQDATLTAVISGPIAYSLACEVGSYSLSGLDASLVYASGQGGNLTKAAPGLTPKVWPGLSIRYEGKPKRRLEQLEEEERERIEEIAEQAVIEAANERTKKAMKASLQASMRAAEIEIAATSYLKLVEQAALLRMEQIEEEDIAIALLLM